MPLCLPIIGGFAPQILLFLTTNQITKVWVEVKPSLINIHTPRKDPYDFISFYFGFFSPNLAPVVNFVEKIAKSFKVHNIEKVGGGHIAILA